jgi:ParB-like chromosome segregation protein Spo0J
MAITWTETTAALKDLKPYDKNPRRISKEAFAKLKQSIEQDGFHQRILCTPDLKVIGGHQRIKALQDLGYKDVQVLTPSRELTEDEYRRLLIRDNLQAGEWDMEALANAFTIEELKDWGFPENLLPYMEKEEEEPEQEDLRGDGDIKDEVMDGVVVYCKTEEEQMETVKKLRELGFMAYAASGKTRIK